MIEVKNNIIGKSWGIAILTSLLVSYLLSGVLLHYSSVKSIGIWIVVYTIFVILISHIIQPKFKELLLESENQ